jgi:hypothetical protein
MTDIAVQGFVDGPDHIVNTALRSGFVAPLQQSPLWGGMAVTASLPGPGMPASLGCMLSLATAAINLAGFTVFDESAALLRDDESCVPLARAGTGTFAGGAINWVALGSRAQIWVQCSKSAARSLEGSSIRPTVFWNYTKQMLLTSPAISGDAPIAVAVLRVNSDGDARVVSPSGKYWDLSGYAALIEI